MEYIRLNQPTGRVSVEEGTVYNYPTHMHSYFEMTLYEPFAGRILLNDRDLVIDKPTCVLVVPSDFHRIVVEGEREARFLKLGFEEAVLTPHCVPVSSTFFQPSEEDAFFTSLFAELSRASSSEAYRRALLNTAVCTMIERGTSVLHVAPHAGYRLATAAVRIINERFSEQITEPLVAEQLSVSPQYLSKIFSETVGVGFSEHLVSVRLNRAAKMLTEGDESVTQICYACGFGSLSHFLRSFKSRFSCSPGEYRRRQG